MFGVIVFISKAFTQVKIHNFTRFMVFTYLCLRNTIFQGFMDISEYLRSLRQIKRNVNT